jgi:hypothetical protein
MAGAEPAFQLWGGRIEKNKKQKIGGANLKKK